MKFFYLVFMIISVVHADWTKDMYERSNNLYEKAKEKSINLVTPKVLSAEEKKEKHFNVIWGDVFDDLDEGAQYIVKLDNAPESAWVADDKKDIQNDIDKILDDMIKTITGDDLLLYKKKISRFQDDISENKEDIVSYREKKINAPMDSKIYTTKTDYDEKIEKKRKENLRLKNDIESVKDQLKKNFSDIGVMLTSEQINVLLARVDGDDIIQMSLIMDVLKHITSQIMELMKESNEELAQAKKYYGMHLITLELVVYIQQKYIDKVNNIYIPKIDTIIDTSSDMILKTGKLRQAEEDTKMRRVYSKNMEAQKLAFKVASLYKDDLIDSRNRMLSAQNKSKANLTLSRNTYKTVMLNVELYDLIAESQNIFAEVSKIQMPNIVPFENIQMQKKYKELTRSMQE